MDTIRINVSLKKTDAQILIALAEDQHRHPRDQAAHMLTEWLRKEAKPEPAPQAQGERVS